MLHRVHEPKPVGGLGRDKRANRLARMCRLSPRSYHAITWLPVFVSFRASLEPGLVAMRV